MCFHGIVIVCSFSKIFQRIPILVKLDNRSEHVKRRLSLKISIIGTKRIYLRHLRVSGEIYKS
jgi:hypothetical protein